MRLDALRRRFFGDIVNTGLTLLVLAAWRRRAA